jgi:hypothetical protein
MGKKEIVLDVAMYPQQSKIPHLGHFLTDFGAFFVVYLRLRRNIKLSFWQMYSKPISSSALTPSGFSATFTVKAS